jgi:heme-degrading monooxygenase HmoA
MHARVSFYDIGDADTAVKGFESAVDTVKQVEGNQGLMLLVDRTGGKAITVVFYDTEEHLEASVEQANTIRQRAADAAGGSVRGVEHYEVALDSRG